MVEGKVTINNETGLHARPASQFIAFASKFNADITLLANGKTANAKSILNVLTLGLSKNSEVTVRVDGNDEQEILNSIIDFIGNLKD